MQPSAFVNPATLSTPASPMVTKADTRGPAQEIKPATPVNHPQPSDQTSTQTHAIHAAMIARGSGYFEKMLRAPSRTPSPKTLPPTTIIQAQIASLCTDGSQPSAQPHVQSNDGAGGGYIHPYAMTANGGINPVAPISSYNPNVGYAPPSEFGPGPSYYHVSQPYGQMSHSGSSNSIQSMNGLGGTSDGSGEYSTGMTPSQTRKARGRPGMQVNQRLSTNWNIDGKSNLSECSRLLYSVAISGLMELSNQKALVTVGDLAAPLKAVGKSLRRLGTSHVTVARTLERNPTA
ncbi:hypothetical protein HDU93_000754, partial [Gonapodya sp. JEL0774]